ncbi:MAG: (Fe-S)-binding protein [Candidatus Methanolliviera hydrocarbonicum]|uniref:(Fe-S)-binding protein n=1 Tax=Candidatus Methanolliviera hydrocarbonicum TaxID=2491085 RepID=A0A520KUM7_9EURY|nr:MAG: (Fe-S)-binding protein [Candidatus Methanolliviera hydrocarbonicum]
MLMGLSILQGRSELTEVVTDIIYKCTLCGACDVSCKQYRDDIDISETLEEFRIRCVEEGQLIPEHTVMIDNLRREGNVFGKPKTERGRWTEGLGVKDINEEQADVFFHAGCNYSYDEELWPIVRGAVTLLENAGVDVGIAGEEESCCGGRAYEIGYQGELEKYAEDVIRRVKASGANKLVTACSDCYSTFKYYYPKIGKALGVEVLHITEYIDRLIREGKIKPTKSVPMRITYHDPCHLGRRGESYVGEWKGDNKILRPLKYKRTGKEGVYNPPRNILKSIPGLELVEMERIKEYSWCCGAGGGVKEAYPDFSIWTAMERVEEAKATGAEAIVTACPWCERNFKDAIKESGERVEVYDVIELVLRAI